MASLSSPEKLELNLSIYSLDQNYGGYTSPYKTKPNQTQANTTANSKNNQPTKTNQRYDTDSQCMQKVKKLVVRIYTKCLQGKYEMDGRRWP